MLVLSSFLKPLHSCLETIATWKIYSYFIYPVLKDEFAPCWLTGSMEFSILDAQKLLMNGNLEKTGGTEYLICHFSLKIGRKT